MVLSVIHLLKVNIVSTRKKRQSNRRLLSQSDDFDKDVIIGNAASSRQQCVVVIEGTVDHENTVNNTGSNLTANENLVNVQTLERCFNEKTNKESEIGNLVNTVEDRIQNAFSTAIDNINFPGIEIAVRLKNASSGRDTTSVTAKSERREPVGNTASFENVSEKNNTLCIVNTNDETQGNIPDNVGELSFPRTYFGQQSHTHYSHTTSTRAF